MSLSIGCSPGVIAISQTKWTAPQAARHLGNEEVAIGPAVVLETLLKFADAQVDRGRAVDRAARISNVVRPLTLAQASGELPRVCFALMQNVSVDARQRALDEITLVVTDPKRSDHVKVLEIGLLLWVRVGLGTLSGAVEAIVQMGPSQALNAQHVQAGLVPPPPPPQGSPQDLLPEIQQQLASDRQETSSVVQETSSVAP